MIADPGRGIVSHDKEKFLLYWLSNRTDESGHVGTVLLMEPAPDFYKTDGQKECKSSWSIITHYLRQVSATLFRYLFVAYYFFTCTNTSISSANYGGYRLS